MKQNISEKQQLFAGVEVPAGYFVDAGKSHKACALCGGTQAKRIYQQAHFPVVRCDSCGLVFADEHFRDEDLTAFYSGDYYQRAYVCHPKEIDAKVSASYLREFRRVDRRSKGGRILDFGSARGTFLAALADSELGGRWIGEGIDINPDEVEMGKRKGIPVRVADIFAGEVDKASFDAVTAFSVLEHMQRPRETLVALRETLRPGGHLLLIVPNGRCLIIKAGIVAHRILGDRARPFSDNVFHEEHLYYFDPETMRRMLEETGFRVVEIGFQPSYLETHPPGPLIRIGASALRLASFLTGRRTMLVTVAVRS